MLRSQLAPVKIQKSEGVVIQCSLIKTHIRLLIKWIWIQHGHVVAPNFFTMEFYKGIIGK